MADIYGTPSLFLPVGWLTALAGSEARVALYAWRDVYGVVRALHLLGLGVFYAPSLLLALRAMGVGETADAGTGGAPRLLLHGGFYVTLVTGLLLFLRDPIGVGLHSMFLPKLLLVAAGFALALGQRRLPREGRARRAGAVALCVIWTATVGLSTWNHIERPIAIGARLRATTAVPR